MWKPCAKLSAKLCVIPANFFVDFYTKHIKNVNNSTFPQSFSNFPTPLFTIPLLLFLKYVFHISTYPTTTTTKIINRKDLHENQSYTRKTQQSIDVH